MSRTITLLQPPRLGFGAGCLRECAHYVTQRAVVRGELAAFDREGPAVPAVAS